MRTLARISVSGLLMSVVFAGVSPAQPVVPNGTLRVTYRQKEDGKLSKSVHEVELLCWNGSCSLTTLTLNQCFEVMGERFFWPKVERSAMSDGDLQVIGLTPTRLVLQEQNSESTFTYRFDYTTRDDESLGKKFQLRSTKFFDDLTAFSGGATKDSAWLGKVISWDLVPVVGDATGKAVLKIDCPPAVHTVPRPN